MPSLGPAGRPAAELRILALGDSYTVGEGVADAHRWPVRLADMLRDRGLNVGTPRIIARTGWTTDELSAAIDAANPDPDYDLVTLLIGVNNQYRGRGDEEYRAHFQTLVNRATAFARGKAARVIAVSIPDWGVTPFATGRDRPAIARAIDRFNAVSREETRRAGAHYADITPISRRALGDASLIAADGLHPSATMYAAWLDVIFPLALRILS
ncbi:MAG TPA: SGNH/GDSL hydrolase family protein [Gemmatimonadaceae bacterium]|nr:SGNH/GDSL hydrolase family protein [Gemmatimonadaceae bacterium]